MEHELAKLCVWREARGESVEGIIAVCWVIRNRMEKYKKSSFDIVSSHNQFSSMTIHSDPQVVMYPSKDDSKFEQISSAFDTVIGMPFKPFTNDSELNVSFMDHTERATFYRNVADSDSVWFNNAVRDGKLIETVQIGKHTFYKEV